MMFSNKNMFIGTSGDDGLFTVSNPPGYKGGDLLWLALAPEVPDFVLGRGGDDVIYTGGGNDTIMACVGDDYIDAGPGNDVMWGGAGADIFAFKVYYPDPSDQRTSGGVGVGNRDQIMDFEQGHDRIDVSRYHGWNYGTGEEYFIGKGEVGAVGADMMIFYRHEGGSTIVTIAREVYVPAEGSGPILQTEIELRGVYDLTPSDFIFNVG